MPETWIEFIEGLLREHNDSQSELARAIGVDQQRISRWLSGQETPSVRTLRTVALATGHSVIYLIALAYEIPTSELGIRRSEASLATDPELTERNREHITNQYRILATLSAYERRHGHPTPSEIKPERLDKLIHQQLEPDEPE